MKPRSLFFAATLVFLTLIPIQQATAQINTERVMRIGRNALYFEDYVLSIQYFNQVINVKPHLAEPYFYRAVAKLYLGDFAGADDDCTEALQRNQFLIRGYLCRSYARMNLKNYKGAIEDCLKGLEFDAENQSLLKNKAIGQLSDKQYDKAEQSLKELERSDPNYVYTHMMFAQLHIERGDTSAAVEDYSRAIAIDRHFAPARAGRAYAFLIRSDYKNALPDLDEAIRIDPDAPDYYINRGLARYNLNNLRGTLEDFDRVIELESDNELALFNRGLIRSQVGDLNRAIEDFDKLINLVPDHHVAIYNRALLRSQVGDYKGAIQDLNVILEAYPTFMPAMQQRSEIKRKSGDSKGADKDYFTAWNMEDKVKAEREDRRKNPEKYAKADSIRTANQDKKRDLDRYNKIILAKSDDSNDAKLDNPVKGRMQEQNVDVQMEPLFTLTFYETPRPGPVRRIMDMSRYLAPFQQIGMKDFQRLLLTNQDKALNDQQVSEHFKSIDQLSSKIGQDPSNPIYFLARAVEFSLVQDINSALDDLERVIKLDPQQTLAYFCRANLLYRRMNAQRMENAEASEVTAGTTASAKSTATTVNAASIAFGTSQMGLDYGIVMRDYERVIEQDPGFIYAWFNRGNIRSSQRDYRNALIDYTKALEINPEFADAWFNRGITQLYLGNRAQGISDLRMAGQCGIYKAYNLIKRFEN